MPITKDEASDLISLQNEVIASEKALQMVEMQRNQAHQKLADYMWHLQQKPKT